MIYLDELLNSNLILHLVKRDAIELVTPAEKEKMLLRQTEKAVSVQNERKPNYNRKQRRMKAAQERIK